MAFKLKLFSSKGLPHQHTGNKFIGAAFLMATSAIGPGFITQTTVFTFQLGASFAFAILVSILLDLIVQWNVWRAVAVGGKKAQVMANEIIPYSGTLLTVLVVAGGLVFNIGNIAGTGLGVQALTGWDTTTGAVVSGIIAIIIFLVKEFGKAMDTAAKWLGFLMIAMVLLVAYNAHPPMMEVMKNAIWPQQTNANAVLTIVGGTVGGYITFAGAHRMLDASAGTAPDLKEVNRSATLGIMLSGIMRILLFLAAFGVVAAGLPQDVANPAAGIFRQTLGSAGEKVFGLIIWSAAITSVVGASYTSVSFLENLHPFILRNRQWFIVAFIISATFIFALYGQPVKILVAAGAINGLILPVSLGLMLLSLHSKKIMGNYLHPRWLFVAGWLVVLTMGYMSIKALAAFLS